MWEIEEAVKEAMDAAFAKGREEGVTAERERCKKICADEAANAQECMESQSDPDFYRGSHVTARDIGKMISNPNVEMRDSSKGGDDDSRG